MSPVLLLPATLLAAHGALPAGSGHDELDLLFSTQVAFAESGNPVVTVGLMTGQDEVSLAAPAGLRIALSGQARAEITVAPDQVLTMRVLGPKPGSARYRVLLDGVPGGDLEALKSARQRWGDRGLVLDTLELGGIVGYPGRVLDNRLTLVVERGFHVQRGPARERAQALARQWALAEVPGVFSEAVVRPTGTIVATDGVTGMTIRQRGMLEVTAVDGGPIEVKRVEYGRGYAHHGFQDRAYHGTIIVTLDPAAKLAVVNRVSGELLLQGLVPAEIFPTAPAAALKAQAISARGELLAKLGVRHLADPYLVCATQHCQVYSGLSREKEATNAAVKRTRGLMLFDEEGHLIDTVYSASCGGHTEHNDYVWEGVARAPLRGRSDAKSGRDPGWKAREIPTVEELRRFIENPPATYCGTTSLGSKVFRWSRAFPDAELDRLVNARHTIGHVTAIDVLSRGVSGRVRQVRFTGTDGSIVVKSELSVRRLLGNLRSGMFVHTHDAAGWRFVGGGWGHGVGMCQYGAIGMAESRKSHQQILHHYYQGSRVERVY